MNSNRIAHFPSKKTINQDIDIFTNLKKAEKAFTNSPVPCMLLKSTYGDYFLDRSKQAIVDWPRLYTKLAEK
jgi:hypothetical protein